MRSISLGAGWRDPPAQHLTLLALAELEQPCGATWRLRRLLVDFADAQFPARHQHLLQQLEDLVRHALREVDEAVIVANVDSSDVHALDARLVGDRSDDIA